MSAEATKTVIVTCIACKAVTKVAGVSAAKETITCPKCKANVSLALARPVREKSGSRGESKPVSLPEPTAEDYQRANKSGRKHSHRGLWLGLLIGTGVGLFILAVVLTLMFSGEKGEPQLSDHLRLLREMNDLYTKSSSEMELLLQPAEILDYNSRHGATSQRLADLSERYNALPAPAKAERNEVLREENTLAVSKRRYQEARQRLGKLTEGINPLSMPPTPQPSNVATADGKSSGPAPSSIAPRPTTTKPSFVITSTDPNPPPSLPATKPASTEVASPAELERVTLTILNLPKEKVTTEFLARVQRLGGSRCRVVQQQWAGDLLILELAPVPDIDRFAARLGFGEVTQLDKKQRTIRLLARAEAVGEDGSLPTLPTDPLDSALADLQSKDVEKRRKAVADLLQIRRDEQREEVLEALLPILGDGDLQVRLNALRALAKWGKADAVDPLLGQLTDTNPAVRRLILELLGQLKDPRAADAIIRECLEKDREAASLALQSLGPKVEPAVLPLLKNDRPEIRLEACRILKRIGTRAAIPELLKLANETKSALTDAAWDAIESIASRKG